MVKNDDIYLYYKAFKYTLFATLLPSEIVFSVIYDFWGVIYCHLSTSKNCIYPADKQRS